MTTDTTVQTTVFQSGNSQAVRLPKAFRFNSKTVEIFRRGDEVVLRETKQTLAEAFDLLAQLPSDHVKDDRPPEERNWALLWGEQSPRPQAKVARKATGKAAPKARARK